MCRIIYCTDLEIREIKTYISKIFKKVDFSVISTPLDNCNIWQIKLKGISELGLDVLKVLNKENRLPRVLRDLYYNPSFSTDSEQEGLYECFLNISEYNISLQDKSIEVLLNNKFFKTIDISSMSFEQCLQSDFIKKIVSRKKKTYIYIDYYSSSIHLKSLCWI